MNKPFAKSELTKGKYTEEDDPQIQHHSYKSSADLTAMELCLEIFF